MPAESLLPTDEVGNRLKTQHPSMKPTCILSALLSLLFLFSAATANEKVVNVSSLDALAEIAAKDGTRVVMKPGVYKLSDYLTEKVLKEIEKSVDRSLARPPVPMFRFLGDRNHFDFRDVTFEIDTSLYAKLPQGGYTRCLIIEGSDNVIEGLKIRNTGPNQGSGGNILSVAGEGNTLENVTVHVHGSYPWGYGDLLGKGGPNLVQLQKQSGIQVLGSRTLLKRCRVMSRAFGHCFYIQAGDDIRLEDCHAEGSVRATSDMLADGSGPAFDIGFRSVYKNRDGRFMITPGYVKSLSEDGFRTYGDVGNVTLLNCTAVHTRAGFEIGTRDDAQKKSYLVNCEARGCERGYLIGSNTIVHRSRGDISHGPLLYLRGGLESDVELELTGDPPESVVHAVATIAGKNHRVRLSAQPSSARFPGLPVLVGFGMPAHAEMASPCEPALAENIDFASEIGFSPVITSAMVRNSKIKSSCVTRDDADLRKDPGSWNLPANGIANGQGKAKQ